MKILITRSNPIHPDPRVEKVARALAGFGYQVSVLGWDRSGELPAEEVMEDGQDPITVQRLPIKADYGHGLANLPNLLRWQWALMNWLRKHRDQFEIIHACDFDTVLPALACRLLWGKKVVYDIFDFYADHLRSTPGIFKRLIRWMDIKSINHADALIIADDSRYDQIKGSKPTRSTVIYNSPSLDSIPPTPVSPHSPESSLRVAYVGLLQVERGLLEILKVMERHPDWELDLAGFGGDESIIQENASRLLNVCWHGRIPYKYAIKISQAADVLFATYDPAIPNHRYSSPNKVFEAMMLGKPILVAKNTNMDRIIETARCGLVIPYGDVDALENALISLQEDPALRKELGQNGFSAYTSTYSWDQMRDRLESIYTEIASDKTTA